MIRCDDFDLETDFYLALMHSLSIITLPLNLLAIYCIVYKSTTQMGAYKWYLLVYQLSSTVFDFIYMVVTLPVIFFPIPMGYPGAFIAVWFSIDGHASVVMVVMACGGLTASILNLFNYRCHLVTPASHFLKISSRGHVYTGTVIYLYYVISCTVGVLDMSPDQLEAKRWVEEEYTCARSATHLQHLQIYMPYKVKRLAITAVACAFVAFTVCVTCILLSYYFLNRNLNLSKRTRDMQKRFFLYLCTQVSIPAFTMFVPILALAYIFATASNASRGLGNMALALLGTHGTVAAVTLIMCNEPYRIFATGPIMDPKHLKGGTMSTAAYSGQANLPPWHVEVREDCILGRRIIEKKNLEEGKGTEFGRLQADGVTYRTQSFRDYALLPICILKDALR